MSPNSARSIHFAAAFIFQLPYKSARTSRFCRTSHHHCSIYPAYPHPLRQCKQPVQSGLSWFARERAPTPADTLNYSTYVLFVKSFEGKIGQFERSWTCTSANPYLGISGYTAASYQTTYQPYPVKPQGRRAALRGSRHSITVNRTGTSPPKLIAKNQTGGQG